MAKKPDTPQVDSLGSRLRQARLAQAARWGRAITQSEVGRDVGVTGVTIGRYEADAKEPSLEMIAKLAIDLECDAGWLAFGKASTGGPSEVIPNYLLRRAASVAGNDFVEAADAVDDAVQAAQRGAPQRVLRLAAMRAVTDVASNIRNWFDIFGQVETGSVIAQQLEEGFLDRLVATKTLADTQEVIDDLSEFHFELTKSYEEAPLPGLAHSLNEIIGVLIRDEIRAEKGMAFAERLLPPPTPKQLDRASAVRLAALTRRRDLSLEEIAQKLEHIVTEVLTHRINGLRLGEAEHGHLTTIAERAVSALGLELEGMIREAESWNHAASKSRAEMVAHTRDRIDATTAEIQRVQRYRNAEDVDDARSRTVRVDGEVGLDVGGNTTVVLRDDASFVTGTRTAAARLRLPYPSAIEEPLTAETPIDRAREIMVEGMRATAMQTAAQALEHYPELDHADLVRIVKETADEAREHYARHSTLGEMRKANCGATIAQRMGAKLQALVDQLGRPPKNKRRQKPQ